MQQTCFALTRGQVQSRDISSSFMERDVGRGEIVWGRKERKKMAI
jgi:hypothetical protein